MVTKDFLIKKTKMDLIIRSLSTLLPLGLLLFLTFVSEIKVLVVYDFIVAMRYVIFVVLEGYLGVKIYGYIKILTDADYCDLILAQRNDERHTYIRLRTNASVVKILIYVIAVALIVAGFINLYVFFTLFGVIFAIIIIYISAWIYFSRKY